MDNFVFFTFRKKSSCFKLIDLSYKELKSKLDIVLKELKFEGSYEIYFDYNGKEMLMFNEDSFQFSLICQDIKTISIKEVNSIKIFLHKNN